jgi:hypothetical protein
MAVYKNTAIAAAVALACIAPARAEESWFNFEAATGESFFQTQGDNTWYQARFPHTLNLLFGAFEVGFTGPITPWLSWHADYAYLGHPSSDATATPSDLNYNPKSVTGCNGQCWPMSRFIGHGNLNGIILSMEPHYDIGHWRFGVEAGPMLYFPTWSETVYNWRPAIDSAPSTIRVHNDTGMRLGAMAGASIGYKRVSIVYQYFWDKSPATSHNPYPPIWKGTHVILLRYRF